MTGTSLVIRADATVAMGTGHVMRCLALAQAWQDAGGRVVFALAQSTPAIQARLSAESCEILEFIAQAGSADDARQTIQLARRAGARWVVADGYQFDAEYQAVLKREGFQVLFVDDYGHSSHYSADLLLNQNAYGNDGMYAAREAHTRLLLGPKYCLLRREFAAWRGWKRKVESVGRKILVTMGGSDPDNVTGVVIEALDRLNDIEAVVVVGGSNPHYEDLRQQATVFEGWLQLKKSVSNMPELMAWADLAIAGAGTTCWEMCLLQLPMALIDLAENQTPIAQALDRLDAAHHLGSTDSVTADKIGSRVQSLLASHEQRVTLAARCGALVDGLGAERVVNELLRA